MPDHEGAFKDKLQRSLTLGQVVETLIRDGADSRHDVCTCLAEALELVPVGESKPLEFFVPSAVALEGFKSSSRYGIRGGDGAVAVGLRRIARGERWSAVQVTAVFHDDTEIPVGLTDVQIERDTLERILSANDLRVPPHWPDARKLQPTRRDFNQEARDGSERNWKTSCVGYG